MFGLLLSDDLLDYLVDMINSFAEYRISISLPAKKRSMFYNWQPVDKYEMLKFIAVLVAMGLDKRPSVKDYWTEFPSFYCNWYHQLFRRERFEHIYHSMMHASEVDAVSKEKIEPFMNRVIKNFQAAFYPYEDVAIDEMVVGYKGRWKYKMYNPSKPSKFHIKTFGLCNSMTGYTCNVLVYYGVDTSYNHELDGSAEKVFDYQGHHVFADRGYTTYSLVDFLSNKGFYYTGTVAANRVNFLPQLKTLKLCHTKMKYYRSEDGVVCVTWKDKKSAKKSEKKSVIAVSTKYQPENVVVVSRHNKRTVKPVLIHRYNQSMNGCDRVDQMLSYYSSFDRKT